MGASGSKTGRDAYGQLANTGIPSPHVPPPNFNQAFLNQYVDLLQHLYYGQRVQGITKARAVLEQTRQSFPLEHAVFATLRCLFDLHGYVQEAPPEIVTRRRDGLPRLEGDIAAVAEYMYRGHGEYVLTRARKELDNRAGVDSDPVQEVGAAFLPFLLSVFDRCMIAPGQGGTLSDVQVLFHCFFRVYISFTVLWTSFEDSANEEIRLRHVKQEAGNMLALCAQLRQQKRLDLELFLIQAFHLENAYFQSPSGGKAKKAVLKELGRLQEMASTKHQVAVIRYHSSWMQTGSTQKAIDELTCVADAFRDCGDGYMQAVTRKGIAKLENSTTSQEKAKQLRAIRLGSIHLHEWLLTYALVLLELKAMAEERFIDYEQVTAAVELLRVGEAVEARRLGPKYHNSSGSLSRIFDMLNVFMEAEASFSPVNRMIFAQYTHDLMRRYPPEFYKATRLADNMLKTLIALSSSWKVDLENKDCKRVAEKAEELAKCCEAEKDWGKASHAALIYEGWMVDAGKSEYLESNARPLLEAAERSATAYFNRSVQNGDWLGAVAHAKYALDAGRYHMGRPGPPITNFDIYVAAMNNCVPKIPAGSAERTEAERLLAEAKTELEYIVPKNGRHWQATPVMTTWQDRTEKKLYEHRKIIKGMESAMIGKVARELDEYNRKAGQGGQMS